MHSADIAAIFAYFAILLWIGVRAMRRARKGRRSDSLLSEHSPEEDLGMFATRK